MGPHSLEVPGMIKKYVDFGCRNFIINSNPIKFAVNTDLSFVYLVMYIIYTIVWSTVKNGHLFGIVCLIFGYV